MARRDYAAPLGLGSLAMRTWACARSSLRPRLAWPGPLALKGVIYRLLMVTKFQNAGNKLALMAREPPVAPQIG